MNNTLEMTDPSVDPAAAHSPTVSAITDTQASQSEVKQLQEEIAHLADLVTSLTTQSCSCNTSRSRCTHSPITSNPPLTDLLHWYHAKYGEASRNCKDPCDWGKLPSRTLAVTDVPGPSPSRLFLLETPTRTHNFL